MRIIRIFIKLICLGTFYNFKPFYIYPPTNKEMEMCLCSKCLNPHCVYKAIKNAINEHEFPSSLSKFLGQNFKCDHDKETNYLELKCISGRCKNNCEILDVMDYCKPFLGINRQKATSYFVFERVKTFYYNKKGEHVSYNRTGRVDKKEHITKIIKELQSMASNYIIIIIRLTCQFHLKWVARLLCLF